MTEFWQTGSYPLPSGVHYAHRFNSELIMSLV